MTGRPEMERLQLRRWPTATHFYQLT